MHIIKKAELEFVLTKKKRLEVSLFDPGLVSSFRALLVYWAHPVPSDHQ